MRAKPLRKTRPRLASPDIKTQGFLKLQVEWYGRLAQEGFPEIEDVALPDRPLKKWSGLSQNDAANSDRVGPKEWPEGPYGFLQELRFHPDLPFVFQSICKHGNNSLNHETLGKVLEMHIQGMNCRQIGKLLGVNYVTVFRAQKKLIEWSNLIEAREG